MQLSLTTAALPFETYCVLSQFLVTERHRLLRTPTLRRALALSTIEAGQVICPSSAFCLMSSSSGGVELHSSALDGLCRVCGRLLSTQRATYPCKDLGNNLEHTFTINTSDDNPEIHPPKVCYNCYRSTVRHLEYDQNGREYNHAIEVVQWKQHGHDCQTCSLYTKSRQGGRPRKSRKNRGRPTGDEITRVTLRSHISSVAAPKCRGEVPLAPARFVSVVGVKRLVCTLCANVVDQGVETQCNHLVCAPCFITWLNW